MINYLKLFLVTLAAFFAIDMLWLGLIARSFYRKHLGFLMAPTTNWTAAIIFYLLFILGILVFVVVPGLQQEQSLQTVLIRAALYGLITYATYDLTNLATLRDWPVLVSVVDIGWGTLLCTLVSGAAYLIGARLG